MSFRPYTIEIAQSAVDDLRARLERVRWPDEEGTAWEMGTSLAYMRELVEYWLRRFDWRVQEKALNQFAHFKGKVQDVDLHFVHERSRGRNAIPLLLLHGWPDSFVRYRRVLPLLTNEQEGVSFDVVVPSYPGFGFSEHTALDSGSVAQIYLELMTQLGYQRFILAGGDIGSFTGMALAGRAPDRLLGLHLTEIGYPDQSTNIDELTAEERKFAEFIQGWWMREGAYNLLQSTKPQSLAFAFNNSPEGLAAWVMSFVAIGTADKLKQRLSFDELLTNISLYWFTQTAASSMRVYCRNAQAMQKIKDAGGRIVVPTAIAHMPWDAPLPRAWAERRANVVQFTEMPRGGHFGAWELPEEFASDYRKFVKALQRSSSSR